MVVSRRSISLSLAGLVAAAIATVAPADTAGAQPTATCDQLRPPYTSPTDLNQDGVSDLVVGVPNASGPGGRADVGAVDIHFRTGAATAQRVTESFFTGVPAPAANDRFGRAVAYADTVGNGCDNLVIGAPGSGAGRGSVVVVRSSNAGLVRSGAVRIVGRTAADGYGTSLAAHGHDLWIGAPYRTVAGHARAGAVDHYRVSGTTATFVETLTENSAGVPGAAETNDRFGEVLDLDRHQRLVIGEPGENVGSVVDAGTVTVARLTSAGRFARASLLSENTPGVPGSPEKLDRFGASVSVSDEFDGPDADLAVGVPGESLGTFVDAGAAYRFDVSGREPAHPTMITQETRGVAGSSEAGDAFGSSVAVIRGSQLVIGVPGKNIGGYRDAGWVVDTEGGHYRQGGPDLYDLGGTLQAGARAGATLSRLGNDNQFDTAGGDQLVVAVPGAAHAGIAGSGEVVVVDQRPTVFADSAGPVRGEAYGAPASAVGNGQPAH